MRRQNQKFRSPLTYETSIPKIFSNFGPISFKDSQNIVMFEKMLASLNATTKTTLIFSETATGTTNFYEVEGFCSDSSHFKPIC